MSMSSSILERGDADSRLSDYSLNSLFTGNHIIHSDYTLQKLRVNSFCMLHRRC